MMICKRTILATLALCVVFGATSAVADVPLMIGFQGYLLNDQGAPVDAPNGLPMTVGLYHEASGGNAFWNDTYGAVSVNNGGFFEVLGGGNNPLPSLELDGTVKYLELSIAGGEPLLPRLQVISVPYAMRADLAGTAIFSEEAGKLGGLTAADFAKAKDVVDLAPSVQELEKKVAFLEGQLDVLANQGGAGCDNECSPKKSVGCSEDLSQTYVCGESGDEDPCFEKLFNVCPGDLKCVSGECACAPAYEVKCIGDTPYELDSCGNKGKKLTTCAEGLCANGGCVKWLRETPIKTSGINDMIVIGGDLFAVGDNGVVLHFDGGSFNWTQMASGTKKHLNSVWGFSDNGNVILYAVGQSGKVVRYQGGKWSTVITGSYITLNAVFGLGAGDIMAVGSGGVMLRTVSGNWKVVEVGDNVTSDLHSVWAASSSKVWVGGADGKIHHLDGDEWAVQPTPEGTGQVRDIWGKDEISIFAATFGAVIKFDSSGVWKQNNLDNGVNFRGLFGVKDPLKLYAVGDGGQVYKGNGNDWIKQTKVEEALGTGANFCGVWGGAEAPFGDIWVIATDGTVAHEGESWVFPTLSRNVTAVWGLPGDPNSQWAVGEQCLALQYQSGEWLQSKIDGTQCDGGSGSVHFNAVWGEPSGGKIFAVGNDGMFKVWNGDGWDDHTGPNGSSHQDLWGIDENNMLIVQKGVTHLWNGLVWQSTGGGGGVSGYGTGTDNFFVVDGNSGKVKHFDGSEWSSNSVTTNALVDIWGTGGNDIWVVGNAGAVYKFNGATWINQSVPEELLPSGTGANLRGVWMSVLSPVYIAGSQGHTFVLDGGMWSKEQTSPPSHHNVVFGISSNNVILGGNSTIYRRKMQ